MSITIEPFPTLYAGFTWSGPNTLNSPNYPGYTVFVPSRDSVTGLPKDTSQDPSHLTDLYSSGELPYGWHPDEYAAHLPEAVDFVGSNPRDLAFHWLDYGREPYPDLEPYAPSQHVPNRLPEGVYGPEVPYAFVAEPVSSSEHVMIIA